VTVEQGCVHSMNSAMHLYWKLALSCKGGGDAIYGWGLSS